MAVKRSRYLRYTFISKIALSVVAVILLTKLELVFIFYRSIINIPVVKAKKLRPLNLSISPTRNIILTRNA